MAEPDHFARLKANAAARQEGGNFRERSLPRNARATSSRNGDENDIGTGGEGSSKDPFSEPPAFGQGQEKTDRQDADPNGEESHVNTGIEGGPKDLISETLSFGKGKTQADRQDWTRSTEGQSNKPSDQDIRRSPAPAGNIASASESNDTDGFSLSHKDQDTIPTSIESPAECSRSESPDLRKDVAEYHTSPPTENVQIETGETVGSGTVVNDSETVIDRAHERAELPLAPGGPLTTSEPLAAEIGSLVDEEPVTVVGQTVPEPSESDEPPTAEQRPATETPGREALNETNAGTVVTLTENQALPPDRTPQHDSRPATLPSALPLASNSEIWTPIDEKPGHKWRKPQGNEAQVELAMKEDTKRVLDDDVMLRGCCGTSIQELRAIGRERSGQMRVLSYEFHIPLDLKKKSMKDAKRLLRRTLDLKAYRKKLNKMPLELKFEPPEPLSGLSEDNTAGEYQQASRFDYPLDVCGAQYKVHDRKGTAGGVFLIDGYYYILTAAHNVLPNPTEDSDDSSDEDSDCDEIFSEKCGHDWDSESDSDLDGEVCNNEWFEGHGADTQLQGGSPQVSKSQTGDFANSQVHDLQTSDGVASIWKGKPQEPRFAGSVSELRISPTWIPIQDCDWALVRVTALRRQGESGWIDIATRSEGTMLINAVVVPKFGTCGPGQHLITAFSDVLDDSDNERGAECDLSGRVGHHLYVITGRGALRAESLGAVFDPKMGAIQLLEGNFEKGDSGAWVIEADTGRLCGILVSAVMSLNKGIVELASSIRSSLKASLVMRHSERKQEIMAHVEFQGDDVTPPPPIADFPAEEHTLPMIPHQTHPELPPVSQILGSLAFWGRTSCLQALLGPGDLNIRSLFISLRKAVEGGRHDAILLLKGKIKEARASKEGKRDIRAFLKQKIKEAWAQWKADAETGTLLNLAAERGAPILKLLLNEVVQPSVVEKALWSPLHVAARKGDLEAVDLLASADKNGKWFQHPTSLGYNPLDFAVFGGFPAVVARLIQHVSFLRLENAPELQSRALRKAVVGQSTSASDNEETLRILLDADSESEKKHAEGYYEALQAAAETGQLRLFEMTRQSTPKLDGQHQRQLELCLCTAASYGHAEVVEKLLSLGISANAEDDRHYPALHLTLMKRHIDVAPVKQHTDVASMKYHPIDVATMKRHTDVALLLVKHQADYLDKQVEGLTAFQWAVRKGYTEVVEHFLASNASFLMPQSVRKKEEERKILKNKKRILHLAVRSGDLSAVQMLLEHGADMEATDRHGDTPLQLAVFERRTETVQFLLGQGADINARGGKNGLPFQIAAARADDKEMAELFMTRGAQVTLNILKAAAKNPRASPKIMNLLLEAQPINDGLELLKASLSRRDGILKAEWLLMHLAVKLEKVDRHLLQNLVLRSDHDVLLKALVMKGIPIAISLELTAAAATNVVDGFQMMEVLLNLTRERMKPTSEILSMAASNEKYGKDLVTMLLSRFEIKISDLTWDEAAGNSRWAPQILSILMERAGQASKSISARLVRRCAANHLLGEQAIRALINNPSTDFPPEAMVEVIRGFSFGTIRHLVDAKSLQLESLKPRELQRIAFASISNKRCAPTVYRWFRRTTGLTSTDVPGLVNEMAQQEYSQALMRQIIKDPLGPEEMLVAISVLNMKQVNIMLDRSDTRLEMKRDTIEAVLSSRSSPLRLLSALLDKATSNEEGGNSIEHNAIVAVARDTRNGTKALMQLVRKYGMSIVTAKVLEVVASNPVCASGMVSKLKEEFGCAFISQRLTRRVLTAALRNWEMAARLVELFEQCETLPVVEEEAMEIARHKDSKTMTRLLQRPFELVPSERLLEAAASNWHHGPAMVELLLENMHEHFASSKCVPKRILREALANWSRAPKILDIFKKRKMSLVVTSSVLCAAAENPISGVQLTKTLLKIQGAAAEITPNVLKAAATNLGCALQLVRLLLPKTEANVVTASVLSAVSGNGCVDPEVLKELLEHRNSARADENVLRSAALNFTAGSILMVVPLDRGREEAMPSAVPPHEKSFPALLEPPFLFNRSGGPVFRSGPKAEDAPYRTTLLWKRGDGTIFNEVTARVEREWAWRDGCSMVRFLLQYNKELLCQSLAAKVARFSSLDMVRIFFNNGIAASQDILTAAVQNEKFGFDVTAGVLRENLNLEVTSDLLSLAAKNPQCGGAVIQLLLRHDLNIRVAPSVIETALGSTWIDYLCFDTLLTASQRGQNGNGPGDGIVSKAVAAVRNGVDGYEMADLLLSRYPSQLSEVDLIEAAAGNNEPSALRTCQMVWQRISLDVVPDKALVAAARNPQHAEQLLRLLLSNPTPPIASHRLIEAAVSNERSGLTITAWLLSRAEPTMGLPASVLSAAASNTAQGPELIDLLLQAMGTASMLLPDDAAAVMEAGAANWRTGDAVVKLLHDCYGNFSIGPAALKAAASNTGCGDAVLEFLNDTTNRPLPESVWVSACGNPRHGRRMVAEILGRSVPLRRVTRSMIRASIRNAICGFEVFEALIAGQSEAELVSICKDLLALGSQSEPALFDEALSAILRRVTPGAICVEAETLQRLDVDTVTELTLTPGLMLYITGGGEKEIEPPALSVLRRLVETQNKATVCLTCESIGWMVRFGDSKLARLLFQNENQDRRCVIDWLEAAANNPFCAVEVTEALLECGATVTTEAWATAIKNEMQQIIALYRNGRHPVPDPQALVSSVDAMVAHPKVMQLLLDCIPDLSTTGDLLMYALTDIESLQLLLGKLPHHSFSETFIAIATNDVDALRLLLPMCPETAITETVWKMALKNRDALCLLLERYPRPKITEAILQAGAPVPDHLQLLLGDRSLPGHLVSDAVLVSAAKNHRSLEYFLEKKADFVATESVLLAAVVSHLSTAVLLRHDQKAQITEGVLCKAAGNPEIMRLLLGSGGTMQVTEKVLHHAVSQSSVVTELLLSREESLPLSSLTLEKANAEALKWLLIKRPDLPITGLVWQSAFDDTGKMSVLLAKQPGLTIDRLLEYGSIQWPLQDQKPPLFPSPDVFKRVALEPHFVVDTEHLLRIIPAIDKKPRGEKLDILREILKGRRQLVTEDFLLKALCVGANLVVLRDALEESTHDQIRLSDKLIAYLCTVQQVNCEKFLSFFRDTSKFQPVGGEWTDYPGKFSQPRESARPQGRALLLSPSTAGQISGLVSESSSTDESSSRDNLGDDNSEEFPRSWETSPSSRSEEAVRSRKLASTVSTDDYQRHEIIQSHGFGRN